MRGSILRHSVAHYRLRYTATTATTIYICETSHICRHSGTLQYVAVCCSWSQCVAVCCSVLQCVAVRCSATCEAAHICRHSGALQCVAVCCSWPQCGVVFYSVLQYVVVRPVRQHTYADTLERYIVGCTSGHAHKNVLYSDLVHFLRVRAYA